VSLLSLRASSNLKSNENSSESYSCIGVQLHVHSPPAAIACQQRFKQQHDNAADYSCC
jgi:hypothetical protein